MTANVGTGDKALRITLTVVLTGLVFAGTIRGAWAAAALVLAAVFLLTSLMSFCPLYAVFGISTHPKPKTPAGR